MSSEPTRTVHGRERAPVDAMAARVTSPGEAGPDLSHIADRNWSVPPMHYPTPPDGTPSLIGSRLGRMQVVGYLYARYSGSKKQTQEHKWLVRCDCGRYEARDGKNWRRQIRADEKTASATMCLRCQIHAAYRSKNRRRGSLPANSPQWTPEQKAAYRAAHAKSQEETA